jgi:nitrite reductase/ring-hydroxylating ferredoxin subunit
MGARKSHISQIGEAQITTATADSLLLLSVDELQDGDVKKVDVPGRAPLAVYRLDGEFFATDDVCTHGAASLADGFVEDGQVECPYHAGRFDIRTGQPTGHPCTVALQVYKVVTQGSQVFVRIPGREE